MTLKEIIKLNNALGKDLIVDGIKYYIENDKVIAVATDKFNSTEVKLLGAEVIAPRAFYGCGNLKSIEIPCEVEAIGYSAFYSCGSLSAIKMPNVKSISIEAFAECYSLQAVEANNAFDVCKGTFKNCTNLQTVELSNVRYIGDPIFEGCTSLEAVKMPNITKIGTHSFKGCASLHTVELSHAVYIQDYAFEGCTSLRNIQLPDGLRHIGSFAFYRSGLEYVAIPESVISIGIGAFAVCKHLQKVKLPVKLKSEFDDDIGIEYEYY